MGYPISWKPPREGNNIFKLGNKANNKLKEH